MAPETSQLSGSAIDLRPWSASISSGAVLTMSLSASSCRSGEVFANLR
jgi:hypothetical protein